MLNPPKTKEEAENRDYCVRRLYDVAAKKYNPSQCAYHVFPWRWTDKDHQCSRSPGHGPDGLYCKQHAKMVEAALSAKE